MTSQTTRQHLPAPYQHIPQQRISTSGTARYVPIYFIKGTGQRYASVIHRADNVFIELVAGGYNQVGGPAMRIPHDLAHYIIEDELRIRQGLWGLLSAGALLKPPNTRVIAGRQPPHATRKSQVLLSQASETTKQVEVIVRAIADLSLDNKDTDVSALNNALGTRWTMSDIGPDQLSRICRKLRDFGAQWEALQAGQALTVCWKLP